jgi:hypothetical protein
MDDHGEAKSEGGGEMSHDHMKKKGGDESVYASHK